jgi:hypothetical protein
VSGCTRKKKMNMDSFIKSYVISGGVENFEITEQFSTENHMQQLTEMVAARQSGKDIVTVEETAPQVLALAVSILSTLIVFQDNDS